MRNSFNFLLIALICMDSSFLFCSILDVFRKMNMASVLHLLMFPHFLWPLSSIVFNASIFMTVAIATERYIALHHSQVSFQIRYSNHNTLTFFSLLP